MALVAGGILKLVFDKGTILESVLLLIVGIYSAILIVFGAKYINEIRAEFSSANKLIFGG